MNTLSLSQTVPIQNIICMGISGILIIFFPVYLYKQITKKMAVGFSPVLLGFSIYVLFGFLIQQLIGIVFSHIPGLLVLLGNYRGAYFGYLLAVALVVDGLGCYLLIRISLRKNGTFYHTMAAGLGYGGAKALLIPGVTIFSNITIALGINSSGLETIVNSVTNEEAEAMLTLLEPLLTSNAIQMLLIGVAQVASLLFYLSLTGLLFKAISRTDGKEFRWYGLGFLILFHLGGLLTSVGFLSEPYIPFFLNLAAAAGTTYFAVKNNIFIN